MILVNKIQCNGCKDIIESKNVHDYVTCSCGANSVDGGKEYLKRTGTLDYKELSVEDTGNFIDRRKYLVWGSKYDKDMNKLPQTIYAPIMNLTTAHIQAILKSNWVKKSSHENTMIKELAFRERMKELEVMEL